jgi:hypothetical protein
MNIEEEINDIIGMLREGHPIPPEGAARYHRIVTGQYAFLASLLLPLVVKRTKAMSDYRKTKQAKSEAEAGRLFDLSQNGKSLLEVGQNMKTMEKMMSTLKLTADVEKVSYNNLAKN